MTRHEGSFLKILVSVSPEKSFLWLFLIHINFPTSDYFIESCSLGAYQPPAPPSLRASPIFSSSTNSKSYLAGLFPSKQIEISRKKSKKKNRWRHTKKNFFFRFSLFPVLGRYSRDLKISARSDYAEFSSFSYPGITRNHDDRKQNRV